MKDGQTAIYRQCTDCGESVGPAMPRAAFLGIANHALEDFDDSLVRGEGAA